MEKTLHMALLFDIFGELLTDKQREYFDLYYNENLTLSEIAEYEGISRQGVRDILMRAEAILIETEQKTGVLKRYIEIQNEVAAIEGYLKSISELNQARFKNGRLLELTNDINDRLQLIKG